MTLVEIGWNESSAEEFSSFLGNGWKPA